MSLLSILIKKQQDEEAEEWEKIRNCILENKYYDWKNAKPLAMLIGTNSHLYMNSTMTLQEIDVHINKLIDKLNILTKHYGLHFLENFKEVTVGNEFYEKHLDMRCLLFFSLFQQQIPNENDEEVEEEEKEEDTHSDDENSYTTSDESNSLNSSDDSSSSTDFTIKKITNVSKKDIYFVDKSFLWVRCDWMYPYFNTHLKNGSFVLTGKDGNKIEIKKNISELNRFNELFENSSYKDIKLLKPIININLVDDTFTLVPRCETQLKAIKIN